MADPTRKPPRAPMDSYLDQMVDEALREAREATQLQVRSSAAERERRVVLPLPDWRDVVARQGSAGSPRLSVMTDRFRRMIEAYVSRQAGHA